MESEVLPIVHAQHSILKGFTHNINQNFCMIMKYKALQSDTREIKNEKRCESC